jgi:hypothetical protein
MAEQLYDTGDVIQAGVKPLEVTAVSFQYEGDEKVRFCYTVRLQSEVDAERAAAKAADEAAAAAAAETEQFQAEQEKAAV